MIETGPHHFVTRVALAMAPELAERAVALRLLRIGGRPIPGEGRNRVAFGSLLSFRMFGIWSRRGAGRMPFEVSWRVVPGGSGSIVDIEFEPDPGWYVVSLARVWRYYRVRYDEIVAALSSLSAQDVPASDAELREAERIGAAALVRHRAAAVAAALVFVGAIAGAILLVSLLPR